MTRGPSLSDAEKNAGQWPDRMPGHDADVEEIRSYLTRCAGLPDDYRVESVLRHGPEGTDAMVITVRTPGDAPPMKVRFPHADDAGKAGALRHAFARQTNGKARMRHPTPAKAADFYTMCCALADQRLDSHVDDATRQAVAEFLDKTRPPIRGYSLVNSNRRFDGLQHLRALGEFQRPEAQRLVAGELDTATSGPVVLIDAQTGERWVRAGELATYLRHVHGGYPRLSQSTCDSLVAEVGITRHLLEVRRGHDHPQLVLYRLPPA